MRVLADEKKVSELVIRLADLIAGDIRRVGETGDSGGAESWALVGVRSRGDLLAQRLAARLTPMIGDRVGSVDITLYRDDLSEIGSSAVVRTTEIPFSLDGLHVVLVDDVLMTGRSVRAALQSLMDMGRPRRVWLAVLVDRGGRELPIAPDHVALDLTKGNTVRPDDIVSVHLQPLDAGDQITVEPRRKGVA